MAELNLLQEKILSDGVIRPGNVLKVDSFLNHQIDVPFISELGKEFKKAFRGSESGQDSDDRSVGDWYRLSYSSVLRRACGFCEEICGKQYG